MSRAAVVRCSRRARAATRSSRRRSSRALRVLAIKRRARRGRVRRAGDHPLAGRRSRRRGLDGGRHHLRVGAVHEGAGPRRRHRSRLLRRRHGRLPHAVACARRRHDAVHDAEPHALRLQPARRERRLLRARASARELRRPERDRVPSPALEGGLRPAEPEPHAHRHRLHPDGRRAASCPISARSSIRSRSPTTRCRLDAPSARRQAAVCAPPTRRARPRPT